VDERALDRPVLAIGRPRGDDRSVEFLRSFACCFAPLFAVALALVGSSLLALRAWRPSERATRSARVGKRLLVVAGALFGLFLVAAGIECEPYVMPERYVGTIQSNAAPLIEAIDRYTAARGEAPMQLEQLVPEFIAAIPETGYRGSNTFGYSRGPSSSTEWELYVFCDWINVVEGNEFCFQSSNRIWRKWYH